MKFYFKGFDVSGQPVADVIEAAGAAEAGENLRRRGIYAMEIREAGAEKPAAGRRSVRKGARLKHIAMFTRQLQVLVSTGTPLTQSLSALERQATDTSWRAILGEIRAAVEQGSALSAAMADHPQYFDSICRSLIAAGESAGNLPAMLDRLASLTRKQLHLRRSLIGAAIYPAILIVVALGVLVTLLTFVLPRFADLFKSLDTPLPPTTQALMNLSGVLRSYWWAILIGTAAAAICGWKWLRTQTGKRTIDTLLLKLPQFGGIIRSFSTARIIRLLGILLQGRVPLVEALKLTEGACGNYHYARLISAAGNAVTRGESLGAALADPDLIAPSVQEAIISGERSGQLGPLLTTLADFMDESNEVTVKSLTSVLEPLILVVLGVLVGFVAISMFLPLFDLTAATQGGA